MNAQTNTKRIVQLAKTAKDIFGDDFTDAKTQEVFLTIKEAKSRGLLRAQEHDCCLNDCINAANRLLRLHSLNDFHQLILSDLDYCYAYIALVATNSILTTA